MMTSSNGNIVRVIGPLWGESTGDLPTVTYWESTNKFPSQRPVTRSFDVSFICVWTNGWASNRGADHFRRYRAHYDVTVIQLSNMIPRCGVRGTESILLGTIFVVSWQLINRIRLDCSNMNENNIRPVLILSSCYKAKKMEMVAYR